MAELKNTNNADISIPLVRHMILNTIRSVRTKFKAEYGEVVLAVDSKHYWRKEAFPYYKQNRKKSRSQSVYNWDQIFAAINEVKSDLDQYFPYPFVDVHGCEADDVIATLVEWTNENEHQDNGLESGPQPVLIVSGDHDFIQLQKYSHVQQYSPIHKKWIKSEGKISEMLVEHILRGDDGDGIPNFLSDDDTFVEEKKRQKSIFKKDMDVWRTESLEKWNTTPHWEKIQRNKKLIDLQHTPDELKEQIISKYLNDRGRRDRTQLINYFMHNKMPLMMQCAGEF